MYVVCTTVVHAAGDMMYAFSGRVLRTANERQS